MKESSPGQLPEIEKPNEYGEMNSLIDMAGVYLSITQILSESPSADPMELREKLISAQQLKDPELAQNYITALKETAERVREIRTFIENAAKSTSSTPEEVLYNLLLPRSEKKHRPGRRLRRGLTPMVRKPSGPMELSYEFPFALTLRIENAEDFEKLDGQELSSGYYQFTTKVTLDTTIPRPNDKKYVTKPPVDYRMAFFPIIVLSNMTPYQKAVWGNKDSDEVILSRFMNDHERGHAVNSGYLNALDRERDKEMTKLKVTWGEITSGVSLMKAVRMVRKLWQVNPDQAMQSKYCKEIIDYALFCAKNELIADVESFEGMSLHSQVIGTAEMGSIFRNSQIDRDSIYNYIAGILGLPPDDPLAKRIFDNYVEVLTKNRNSAATVMRAYRRQMLQERKSIFKWVLVQIPLKDWSQKLEELGFIEEAVDLMTLSGAGDNVPQSASDEYFEKVLNIQTHYAQLVKQNQRGLLLPLLREAKKKLEELEDCK